MSTPPTGFQAPHMNATGPSPYDVIMTKSTPPAGSQTDPRYTEYPRTNAEPVREVPKDAQRFEGDGTLANDKVGVTPDGTVVDTRTDITQIDTRDGLQIRVEPDGTVMIDHKTAIPDANGNKILGVKKIDDLTKTGNTDARHKDQVSQDHDYGQNQSGAQKSYDAQGDDDPLHHGSGPDDNRTTLNGDGKYETADGTIVEIKNGVVTITSPDGQKLVVEKDGTVKIDLPTDINGDGKPDPDINGDGIPDIDLDGDGKPDIDKDGDGKKDEEPSEVVKEPEQPKGPEKPEVPTGGGAPSGGGGGGPTGGSPGGGNSGGTTHEKSDKTDHKNTPKDVAKDIFVSPDLLEADAREWDNLASAYSGVPKDVEALAMEDVDFGLAAAMIPGYNAIRQAFNTLSAGGIKEFNAISAMLKKNAADYRKQEEHNAQAAKGMVKG